LLKPRQRFVESPQILDRIFDGSGGGDILFDTS
jgi:hypothetical protein